MVQSYNTLHAKYNDYFVVFSVQTDTKALALKQYKDRCQENKNFKVENAKAKKQENVCENVEEKKMQQLISNQVAVPNFAHRPAEQVVSSTKPVQRKGIKKWVRQLNNSRRRTKTKSAGLSWHKCVKCWIRQMTPLSLIEPCFNKLKSKLLYTASKNYMQINILAM